MQETASDEAREDQRGVRSIIVNTDYNCSMLTADSIRTFINS